MSQYVAGTGIDARGAQKHDSCLWPGQGGELMFHISKKCLLFPALFRANWTGQFACGQGNGSSSSGGDW